MCIDLCTESRGMGAHFVIDYGTISDNFKQILQVCNTWLARQFCKRVVVQPLLH